MMVAELVAWLQQQPQDAVVGRWEGYFREFASAHGEVLMRRDDDGREYRAPHVVLSEYDDPGWHVAQYDDPDWQEASADAIAETNRNENVVAPDTLREVQS